MIQSYFNDGTNCINIPRISHYLHFPIIEQAIYKDAESFILTVEKCIFITN